MPSFPAANQMTTLCWLFTTSSTSMLTAVPPLDELRLDDPEFPKQLSKWYNHAFDGIFNLTALTLQYKRFWKTRTRISRSLKSK